MKLRGSALAIAMVTPLATAAVACSCGIDAGGLLAPLGDASTIDAPGVDARSDDGGALVDADDERDAPSTNDAPPDAPPSASVVIAKVGSVASSSGLAQQHHIVYGAHSARWWLFTIESATPSSLVVMSSPDFATWTRAPDLALPLGHGGAGGNFSVDYGDINGQDVVHLTLGLHATADDRRRFHTRALITGASIAFDVLVQVSFALDPLLVDPDGASTTIGTDNHVADSSGWTTYGGNQGTGNESSWRSIGLELGTSWTPQWGGQDDISIAQHTVNARAIVPLATGNLLAVWEAADVEPDPTHLAWSRWNGIQWTSAAPVFTNVAQNANDWSVCRVNDTDVHAVRRTIAGAYEHARYDGNKWKVGQGIPADAGKVGTGVVLLCDGARVVLATIASDAASSVRAIQWSTGAWSSWRTLEGASAARAYLSGWSGGGKAAVVWTQASGGAYEVAGTPVAFQ